MLKSISTFSGKAIKFYLNLVQPNDFPKNIRMMNPYKSKDVQNIVQTFYSKYFNDNNKRIFIIGINPGRFGGGITGISFTDPVALIEKCGISNDLGTKKELSSEFIYKVIDNFGGTEKFFSKYFLTAIYSLAFLKDGKNFNYYDDKILLKKIKPHLMESIKRQIEFGCSEEIVICLGKKNSEFLSEINQELKYFKEIKTLNHPRYIMQYRRRFLQEFINEYLRTLNQKKIK